MDFERQKSEANPSDYQRISIVSLTSRGQPIRMVNNGHVRKYIRSRCSLTKSSSSQSKYSKIQFLHTDRFEKNPKEFKCILQKSDGIIFVIDAYKSEICVLHEAILKKVARGTKTLLLFVNDLDKLILKKNFTLEEVDASIQKSIQKVNTFLNSSLPERPKVIPINFIPTENGSVFFGSLEGDWIFTIRDFASQFACLFKTSSTKLNKRLWYNHFYNKETKKWSKSDEGLFCERGFALFILRPLAQILHSIRDQKKTNLQELIELFKIELSEEDLSNQDKKLLFVTVMQSWFPS